MLDKETTCCFTGHRPEKMPFPESENSYGYLHFRKALERAIQDAVNSGYRHFLTGMSRGVDFWAAQTVIALKKAYHGITLEAAIPFDGQDGSWREKDRQTYRRILSSCDSVTILSPVWTSGVMYSRNRYMVDNSSMLIAAYTGQSGGTRYTYEYALSKGLTVVNVFEQDYYDYTNV